MVALLAVVLAFASLASCQEPEPANGGTPVQQEPAAEGQVRPGVPEGTADLDSFQLAKALDASMRLAMPGPQHERLRALEGYYEVTMELTPPGMQAERFPGEARAMAVLGGRYLLVNLRVRLAGIVLEGLYLLGFDNLRNLHTLSLRDSMSTWAVDCSGPVPEQDADRVRLEGVLVDAASPTGRPFSVALSFHDDGLDLAVTDTIRDQQVVVMTQSLRRKPDPRDGAATAGDAAKPAAGDGGKR